MLYPGAVVMPEDLGKLSRVCAAICDENGIEPRSDVGQAMAAQSPRKDVAYHFQVVEMEEPNAFALPGGHIYVSRGLLVVANSEAELANVLGIKPEQAEFVYRDIEAKRRTTRYMHLKPVLVEPVSEIVV